MSIGRRHRPWVAIALFVLAASRAPAGQEPGAPAGGARAREGQRTVLALYPNRREAPAGTEIDRGLRRILGQQMPERLAYYSEFIDLERFDEPSYQIALRQFLHRKYEEVPIDLIIATSDATLRFVMANRNDLFQGIPVVFSAGTGTDGGPDATGVTSELNLRDTLRLATVLQPETEQVFVVSGAAAWDRYYERLAREQFKEFEGRLAFTYLSGLPMADLLRRVAALPERSILYFTTLVEDGTGRQYVTLDAMDQVLAAANRPLYIWHTVAMGRGVVGGSLHSTALIADALASLAVRVLNGEDPASIPTRKIDANVVEFDWRQLNRWGIGERLVPPGSVVRFRVPGVWERYRPYILAGLSVLLLQTVLIGGLLLQRARRMRTEARLKENQQRYQLATAAGAVGVWDWDPVSGHLYLDPLFKRILGYRDHEISNHFDAWAALTPVEDGALAAARECCEGRRDHYDVEHRMRHRDGTLRWFLTHGTAVKRPDGTVSRVVGTAMDITERVQAREAIRASEARLRASHEEIQHLAGRLIAAQEEERTRIARDLHDDVSQQLAGLSIGLSGLRRQIASKPLDPAVSSALSSLQERAIMLGESIRTLSHDLHPGVLEHAGLVAALSSHCAALEKEHAIRLDLQVAYDMGTIPSPPALCLYRVAQEALRNVISHARATSVDVELVRTRAGAELTISDNGVGFNAAEQRLNRAGLGLISIHERVRLAGGTVSITSSPGQGTTVKVSVPFDNVHTRTSAFRVSQVASR
jgi:PAS domain S-box-containing protein